MMANHVNSLSLVSLCAALFVQTIPALAGPTATTMASVGAPVVPVFAGHAVADMPSHRTHLDTGLDALQKRIYPKARTHLEAALDEFRMHSINDDRVLRAKCALALVYLAQDKPEPARKLFEQVIARAKASSNQAFVAQADVGIAESALANGQLSAAQTHAKTALDTIERLHLSDKSLAARAWICIGEVCTLQKLSDASVDAYGKAVSLLQGSAGNRYLLAQAEARRAVALEIAGRNVDSKDAAERAMRVLADETRLDLSLVTAPQVLVRWDQFSPASRVLPDADYPLRYMLVGDLRIAAVPIRTEHLIAVLISLTNCGRERLGLAVGPVSMTQLEPKHKPFGVVAPQLLDLPLEEEHITALTWRRRALNHIQKTRFIPGYLKNGVLDADNFFGNNQFGPYGLWPTTLQTEAPIVTREEFLYGKRPTPDPRFADFLTRCAVGYFPTFLEPGESKTGLVYFLQERFDSAKVRINIGNLLAEFPFHSAGPR